MLFRGSTRTFGTILTREKYRIFENIFLIVIGDTFCVLRFDDISENPVLNWEHTENTNFEICDKCENYLKNNFRTYLNMCTKQWYDFFFWSNEKYKRVCIFDRKYEYDMDLTLVSGTVW